MAKHKTTKKVKSVHRHKKMSIMTKVALAGAGIAAIYLLFIRK